MTTEKDRLTHRFQVHVSRAHRRADGTHPAIQAFLTELGVGAAVTVDDFVDMLASELRLPRWAERLGAGKRRRAQLHAAAERVLQAMKDQTRYLV